MCGLPGQGLKAQSSTEKYKLILEKKQSITIPDLCQGCPTQFVEYLWYCRSLKFGAKPNIPYLIDMFRDLFKSQGYTRRTNNHSSLDWDWNRHDSTAAGDGVTVAAAQGAAYGIEEGLNNDTVATAAQPKTATRLPAQPKTASMPNVDDSQMAATHNNAAQNILRLRIIKLQAELAQQESLPSYSHERVIRSLLCRK